MKIDIRSGLAPLRQKWIEKRGDTIELDGPSSRYGQERLADPELASLANLNTPEDLARAQGTLPLVGLLRPRVRVEFFEGARQRAGVAREHAGRKPFDGRAG